MKNACVAALGLLLAAGCSGGGGGGGGGTTPTGRVITVGDPIEGLPAATLASFERGREIMQHRFTPEEGLGPYYNTSSCVSCHETPVVGGSAPRYRNFYIVARGFPPFQAPIPAIPALPSVVVPNFTSPPFDQARVVIPAPVPGLPQAVLQRNAPPMFGVGLFEFVSDQTIMSLSDPDDANSDGLSGRYNRDSAFNIGRFGYKSQVNNLESFTRGPLQNQMGITTDPVQGNAAIVSLSVSFLPQVGGGQNSPTTDTDDVPDPEMATADVADLITFGKFLAPPSRLSDTEASIRGEMLFSQLNCVGCHLPSIPSSVGDLHAYTDLLLHDMGPELGDGLSQGFPQASTLGGGDIGQEFRTQPLWGVRFHGPFLHDGRADTLDEAIRAHGGEASAIRDAYINLTQEERDDIIAFLEIL